MPMTATVAAAHEATATMVERLGSALGGGGAGGFW
jgi:hypothetical protein